MLSSIDSKVEELGIERWSLKFKEPTREIRFQIYNTTQSLKFSKLVYYITFILFVAYSIVNAVIEQEITFGYAKLIIIIVGMGLLLFIASDLYKKYYNLSNILVSSHRLPFLLLTQNIDCSCGRGCEAGVRLYQRCRWNTEHGSASYGDQFLSCVARQLGYYHQHLLPHRLLHQDRASVQQLLRSCW